MTDVRCERGLGLIPREPSMTRQAALTLLVLPWQSKHELFLGTCVVVCQLL